MNKKNKNYYSLINTSHPKTRKRVNWHGYISSSLSEPFEDPMTMIINEDGFYTETSGHLMPTIYPNTQQSEFEDETNRYHWWYLKLVYAGQYFYQHFFYEIMYFSNDTLEMQYNFWDDPEPWPEAGTIFLVRESTVGINDDIPVNSGNKRLLRIIDIMGREVDAATKGEILIYQYDDGSYEKNFNNSPYRN